MSSNGALPLTRHLCQNQTQVNRSGFERQRDSRLLSAKPVSTAQLPHAVRVLHSDEAGNRRSRLTAVLADWPADGLLFGRKAGVLLVRPPVGSRHGKRRRPRTTLPTTILKRCKQGGDRVSDIGGNGGSVHWGEELGPVHHAVGQSNQGQRKRRHRGKPDKPDRGGP